jgi:hypothetical protein
MVEIGGEMGIVPWSVLKPGPTPQTYRDHDRAGDEAEGRK